MTGHKGGEKSTMNLRNISLEIIDLESKTISLLKNSITDELYDSLNLIMSSKGRLVITGIGKSAIVGQKLVATFNSTGTPSLFMHAADAMHGDLGMVGENDVVLILSKSGETEEIKKLIPTFKRTGNKIIAMVSNTKSHLATQADFIIHTPIEKEADPFDLIPSASSIAQIAMGDVMAISLLRLRGFTRDHFAKFHPGGMIGKTLLMEVGDLSGKNPIPKVDFNDDINQVIVEISEKRLGATAVLQNDKLVGVITDGDLRRMLQKSIPLSASAGEVMTKNPQSIEMKAMVTEAMEIFKAKNITQLLVTDQGKYVGILHVHDVLKEGF